MTFQLANMKQAAAHYFLKIRAWKQIIITKAFRAGLVLELDKNSNYNAMPSL
jgi:hypothetical protein